MNSMPSTNRVTLAIRRQLFTSLVGGLALLTSFAIRLQAAEAPPGLPPATLEFNRDIRPILSDKCFACHGFDAKKRQADLRLDTVDGAYAARDEGAAIVPGDLAKSQLWQRITTDNLDERMPPADSHKSLSPDEVERLRRWIEQGANYQKHWAFEAPSREIAIPDNAAKGHPVDAFILERLQREGWQLAPEADRSTLIRRVAFALTGLPPTWDAVQTFVNDHESGAYERMVDRYLASRHFGEEMARHWLDVARYADTHGMHLDNERQTWGYRDWVVNAFNRNQPFHEFTIDQLAGDLVPNPSLDQLVATGYNRCNVTSSEGGSIDDELIFRYAVDRTSTMVQTWMGLTAGCAVCHDHKFDPITQREFYSLYAFFHSAADPAMDGNALLTPPFVRLETNELRQQLSQADQRVADAQSRVDEQMAHVAYVDPATTNPPSAARDVEVVWFDDQFPQDGELTAHGAPTQWVTAADNGPVLRGERSLRRSETGIGQDVWSAKSTPLMLPAAAKLYAHVWLDPANPPRAIMLQYRTTDWLHRAVWGDYDAIPWGEANSTQRVAMGPLPATGMWVRLEVPAEKLGLNSTSAIHGIAVTQYGGVVFWDQGGVSGRDDPARDPNLSFHAWWQLAKDRETAGLDAELQAIAKRGPDASSSDVEREQLRRFYLQNVCTTTKAKLAEPLAQLTAMRAAKVSLENAIPSTFVFRDQSQPRESFVMMRGAYNKPGDKVEPGVMAVLPALVRANESSPATRLDLAKWLVTKEHPLTARVTVNRFWQQLFGTGLVKTSYDFGSQGEPPSHPELLDWLAVHFQESGWDVKQFVRLLVTSATFRQSSRVTPEQLEKDPANRWLARGPRFRLDAEPLRDNALYVSGLIDLRMGGKGVNTYQPANIWEPVGFAGSNTRMYQQDSGASLYRRSLYTFLKRTAPPPFMSNFDAPNREQFCTRRERSNTPLQALQLMNDVQHIEAARALAQRMILQGGDTPDARIQWVYRTLLARDPLAEETRVVADTLAVHRERYARDLASAQQLIHQGQSQPSSHVAPDELAAYTLIANLLLNLDETVTRN